MHLRRWGKFKNLDFILAFITQERDFWINEYYEMVNFILTVIGE